MAAFISITRMDARSIRPTVASHPEAAGFLVEVLAVRLVLFVANKVVSLAHAVIFRVGSGTWARWWRWAGLRAWGSRRLVVRVVAYGGELLNQHHTDGDSNILPLVMLFVSVSLVEGGVHGDSEVISSHREDQILEGIHVCAVLKGLAESMVTVNIIVLLFELIS
jgi:hypothetical protein